MKFMPCLKNHKGFSSTLFKLEFSKDIRIPLIQHIPTPFRFPAFREKSFTKNILDTSLKVNLPF